MPFTQEEIERIAKSVYDWESSGPMFVAAKPMFFKKDQARERILGSTLEISEAKIDGIISGEEGRDLFNARLAGRELTPEETSTFWKIEHWKLDRMLAQEREDQKEDAFWDDLLSVLRRNRASCAAVLGARRLEEIVIEVKRRRS